MKQPCLPYHTETITRWAVSSALARTVGQALLQRFSKEFAEFAEERGVLILLDQYEEHLRTVMVGWVLRVEFDTEGFRMKVETPGGTVEEYGPNC